MLCTSRISAPYRTSNNGLWATENLQNAQRRRIVVLSNYGITSEAGLVANFLLLDNPPTIITGTRSRRSNSRTTCIASNRS
jgi:hypothetical protein